MDSLIKFDFQGEFSQEEKELFTKTQTADLSKIYSYLKVDPKSLGLVKYFIFDSHQGKIDADPNHSVSRAVTRYNENAVYRFWDKIEDPSFPHELTHLVAHHLDTPYLLQTEVDQANGEKLMIDVEMVSNVFMQEGLAVAIDDLVFNKKLKEEGEFKFIDDWCREQIDLVPESISSAMENFDTLPNKIIIPLTASLSKFLITKYGLEKYIKVYCGLKETSSIEENIKVIEEIYSLDESTIFSDWKSSLL